MLHASQMIDELRIGCKVRSMVQQPVSVRPERHKPYVLGSIWRLRPKKITENGSEDKFVLNSAPTLTLSNAHSAMRIAFIAPRIDLEEAWLLH
jgi:hypothetical protein